MNIPLSYDKRGPVALVSFDRPAARNALTPEMLCRLADAVMDFDVDASLHVLIVTGRGDQAFSAGGDLGRTLPLLTGDREPEDDWDRRLLADPRVMAASSLRGYPLHKPVIAAVNGVCLAAGFELLLGTDIRLAVPEARFGLPEVQRGLVPFAGSMVRLPRQVPYARAMEILLTGEAFGADEALAMGLVNHVVPAGQLLERAWAIAERIARNGPLALRRLKRTVAETSGRSLDEAFALEDETRRIVLASDDAREGPRAFMHKREPRYAGR